MKQARILILQTSPYSREMTVFQQPLKEDLYTPKEAKNW